MLGFREWTAREAVRSVVQVVLILGFSTGAQAWQQSPAATAHSALIRQYCVGCHNNSLKTADISFQGADLTKVGGDPALWEKALWKLQTNQMPPAGMPKPARRSQARASDLPGNRIGPRSGHSSKSRKPYSSSPEPRGIQQRDPRLAGAGCPPERQPPPGRFGIWVRQHWRRPFYISGAG